MHLTHSLQNPFKQPSSKQCLLHGRTAACRMHSWSAPAGDMPAMSDTTTGLTCTSLSYRCLAAVFGDDHDVFSLLFYFKIE